VSEINLRVTAELTQLKARYRSTGEGGVEAVLDRGGQKPPSLSASHLSAQGVPGQACTFPTVNLVKTTYLYSIFFFLLHERVG